MIEIVADIPKVNFLATIPDFKLTFDGISVLVEIFSVNNKDELESIYLERFQKNFQDVVIISDLSHLLEPYVDRSLSTRFRYSVREERQGEIEKDFAILYSKSEIDITAEQFVSNYYLSHMQGAKELYPDISEFIHFVNIDSSTAVAKLTYDRDGVLTDEVKEIGSFTAINELITLDISPSKFEKEGYKLIEYTIQVGDRVAKYYLNHDPVIKGTPLLFTNSFGCQEVFVCKGITEVDTKLTREAGVIQGQYQNYSIEEEKSYQCNTGAMDTATANWAEDLLRSDEVYLLEGNLPGKSISIIESKSTRSNALGSFDSYTLTYRLAQRNHNILKLREGGRVFDHTFDLTFN